MGVGACCTPTPSPLAPQTEPAPRPPPSPRGGGCPPRGASTSTRVAAGRFATQVLNQEPPQRIHPGEKFTVAVTRGVRLTRESSEGNRPASFQKPQQNAAKRNKTPTKPNKSPIKPNKTQQNATKPKKTQHPPQKQQNPKQNATNPNKLQQNPNKPQQNPPKNPTNPNKWVRGCSSPRQGPTAACSLCGVGRCPRPPAPHGGPLPPLLPDVPPAEAGPG